jgi:hypothetical protein
MEWVSSSYFEIIWNVSLGLKVSALVINFLSTEHNINIWLDSLMWSSQSSRAGHRFPDTDPIILPYTVCSNCDHDNKCSSVILQDDIGQFCWLGLVTKKKSCVPCKINYPFSIYWSHKDIANIQRKLLHCKRALSEDWWEFYSPVMWVVQI